MRSHRPSLLFLAAALVVTALGGSVWAEGRAPTISGVDLTPVWGSVYKLSAQVRAPRGQVTAAEYRVGHETGPLFAADGLLDSQEELVESYVDVGNSGTRVEIRALGGGGWSEWQEVAGPGEEGGSEIGCDRLSSHQGSAQWFRGPVTVDCTKRLSAEGAAAIEYSISFTDWEPAGNSFRIESEGVHWVQVRSVGEDGTPGLPSTFRVAIDSTPPRLRMQVPPAPSMTHAEQLFLDFMAEDDLSGVDLVVADMDAEQEIMAGVPVDLWELPLGKHTLAIYARDRAGNASQLAEWVPLEITVDTGALAKMVQLFAAKGRLDGYTGLRQRLLGLIERAQAAQAAHNAMEARSQLEAFVESVQQGMAEGLVFEDAGRVLAADATWLMEHLEGDTSGRPPAWAHN